MAGEAFAGRIHQAAAERERRLIREGRRACAVPLACALLLTLAPAAASAQERTGVQVSEEGVRLDFQDADLRMVIAALAELAGLTVVYAELPSRPVTLRSATPVPLAELRRLLESVARANGLVLVDEAGVVRIAPEGAAAAVPAGTLQPLPPRSESAGEDVRLFVHRLRHARAETLAQTLAELFDFGGRTSGGTLAGRRPLSQELRGMRVPPGFPSPDTAAPPPARAFPGEAGAPGRGLAAGLRGPVQVVPDALTNALLIRASPADYETLRAAIEELDARPLQVLIEVLIAEVRRDSRFGLGIDVTVPEQRDSETGISFGGEIEGHSTGDVALRALGVGGVSADVVLRLLASSGDVTILSRPVILTQNNQEARILVGSERPFVQLFRALPTDAAVRDQVVQYRDVGTHLTIRPTINPDGYVTLWVLQEVSTATAETQFGAPVISTREAETQLLVKDGHTAVIGGLIDQQRDVTASGIPVLKDIPVLGALFRSTQRRRDTTELFLFLTPHVLRTDADMEETQRDLREATEHLRRRLREPIPLFQRPDSSTRDPSRQ
jgi:general secretion pathway protein D